MVGAGDLDCELEDLRSLLDLHIHANPSSDAEDCRNDESCYADAIGCIPELRPPLLVWVLGRGRIQCCYLVVGFEGRFSAGIADTAGGGLGVQREVVLWRDLRECL